MVQSGLANQKPKSISIFKSNILKFIYPKPNNVYYSHNPKGIKLLTRFRFGLDYLCEHKFKHNFEDCLNPLCLCNKEIETSTHYQLHCPTYIDERLTPQNKTISINCSIFESSDAAVTKIFCLVITLSVVLLIPSFWTQQLNTSTQRFDGSIITPV